MLNRKISKQEYEALVAGGKIIEQKDFGVKVWLLPHKNQIVKLFRTKRLWSSGRLYPYNTRFARNAYRIQARGIAAPHIVDLFYCPEIERHGVVYDLLAGESFFNLFPQYPDSDHLFHLFARFLVELHAKGIYFRSVHPGNVLLLPDQKSMGLIDIQDMRFYPFPLPKSLRARNFRHLYNSEVHSVHMRAFGFEAFVDLYLHYLPHSHLYKQRLKPLIMNYDQAWLKKHDKNHL